MLDLTPFLRLYAKKRMAQLKSQDSAAVQQAQLLQLISKAKNTRFGRTHDFKNISRVEDFQERVPLRAYESFWEEYWQPTFPFLDNCTWPRRIPYFPVTSGTTSGTTKYIPYTPEMDRSNAKAALDVLVHHLHNRPGSRIFAGKNFMMGGSTELMEQAPGIYSGDLSGIAVVTMPWWARLRSFPPRKLALIKNWEEKIDIFSRRVLQEDIRSISGVPSWMLIFFRKLFELKPDAGEKITALLPKLELIIHGGVNFSPYQEQFKRLLEGSSAELREVYPASEGFIASADRNYGEGLRLNCDHGIFFEFVPVEELDAAAPARHWLGTVEMGCNYAIALSTCAGVWGYVIGDTVKFINRTPPRILITGRTSYCLSAFGEHLIAEEIEDAVSTAAQKNGLCVTDYSVGAVYPQSQRELGGHLFVVEFRDGIPNESQQQEFCRVLDRRLCERNEDYEAHRAQGFGLLPPKILPVPSGAFAAWMKSRGKLGGQNKVPRIISDRTLFNELCGFMRQASKS